MLGTGLHRPIGTGGDYNGGASGAVIHETATYHNDLFQLIIDARDDAVPAPLRRDEPYPRKLVERAERHVESPGSLAHQLHQALQTGVVPGREADARDHHPQHVEHTRRHVATHTGRAPSSISLLPERLQKSQHLRRYQVVRRLLAKPQMFEVPYRECTLLVPQRSVRESDSYKESEVCGFSSFSPNIIQAVKTRRVRRVWGT